MIDLRHGIGKSDGDGDGGGEEKKELPGLERRRIAANATTDVTAMGRGQERWSAGCWWDFCHFLWANAHVHAHMAAAEFSPPHKGPIQMSGSSREIF